MKRAPALIVAVALLLIACGDPVFCADGCDRGASQGTTAPVACGACVTCQSSLLPEYRPPQQPAMILAGFTSGPDQSAYSAEQDSLDHPPRIA